MKFKRITLFCGHYGSGKTNIAVNCAIKLKKDYKKVAIADLDIVNPYFRTKDSEKTLEAHSIKLISSEYAGSNVDVPALPSQAYSLFDNKELKAVIDVGGDDRGALALGRYAPLLKEENDYDMLLVINKFRPLTPDAESTVEVMREIEQACGIQFTGIVNNSNLGDETCAQDVLSSIDYAREVAEVTNLPVKMTTVREELYGELSDKIDNLMPIRLYVKQSWTIQEEKH